MMNHETITILVSLTQLAVIVAVAAGAIATVNRAIESFETEMACLNTSVHELQQSVAALSTKVAVIEAVYASSTMVEKS